MVESEENVVRGRESHRQVYLCLVRTGEGGREGGREGERECEREGRGREGGRGRAYVHT